MTWDYVMCQHLLALQTKITLNDIWLHGSVKNKVALRMFGVSGDPIEMDLEMIKSLLILFNM